jgi:hypothetical protein
MALPYSVAVRAKTNKIAMTASLNIFNKTYIYLAT